MKTEELETNLKVLYDELFEHFGLDKATGLFEDSKSRFSGYPYVGLKYAESKKKILFVGLDTGVDEKVNEKGYHDFCSRRMKISVSAQGKTYKEIQGYPLRPHMAGTYLLAMLLLSDCHHEWKCAKEQLFLNPNSVNAKALSLKENKDVMPCDVLDYIAQINVFRFVSHMRGKRSGGQDRKWRDKSYEIDFLKREIEVFQPDILVFQGSSKWIPKNVMGDFRTKYRVICGYHPSYWGKDANKVKYVQSLAEQR